jgi:hypothetical protein
LDVSDRAGYFAAISVCVVCLALLVAGVVLGGRLLWALSASGPWISV